MACFSVWWVALCFPVMTVPKCGRSGAPCCLVASCSSHCSSQTPVCSHLITSVKQWSCHSNSASGDYRAWRGNIYCLFLVLTTTTTPLPPHRPSLHHYGFFSKPCCVTLIIIILSKMFTNVYGQWQIRQGLIDFTLLLPLVACTHPLGSSLGTRSSGIWC